MRLVKFASCCVLILITALASAQNDTTFTYQGELRSNDTPANGQFSFSFVLFDADVGGNQASGVLTRPSVSVVDGRFSVELDWSADVFDNSDRWLQIGVNGVFLTPRNPITRAPYALQTRGIFVNDNGKVGIATDDPQYNLHVFGGGVQNPAIRGEALNPQFGTGVEGVTDASLGFGVYGRCRSTTGLCYGVYGYNWSTDGAGVRGYVLANSGVNYGVTGATESIQGYDFFANGAGVDYGAESSRRWKSNIQPIDHPLDKVSKLRGVYFDWDADHGGKHDVGMIAEEVGQVLPEIVQYEENGVDAHGMDYSKLTPLLVEAVNALHAKHVSQLTRLQKQNKAVQTQNEMLQARLVALEQLVGQPTSNATREQSK